MNPKIKVNFDDLTYWIGEKNRLRGLHEVFNQIRHTHTNYDELIKEGTPKEKRELFAEISALIVMKFPEMQQVAIAQCLKKKCVGEFKKFNTFETVVEFEKTKPSGPTKKTLIRMVTKVLDKEKHFVQLLDWLVNGKKMTKSLGFEHLLKTKFKNIWLLLEKFKKGELK